MRNTRVCCVCVTRRIRASRAQRVRPVPVNAMPSGCVDYMHPALRTRAGTCISG